MGAFWHSTLVANPEVHAEIVTYLVNKTLQIYSRKRRQLRSSCISCSWYRCACSRWI